MTFSLLGRCARTGQFGAAVTTSSVAVGTRVPFVAPGLGGVLTQHRTDPRLGPRGLELLRSGCSAAETDAVLTSLGYRPATTEAGRRFRLPTNKPVRALPQKTERRAAPDSPFSKLKDLVLP